jgi:hypothetical protein
MTPKSREPVLLRSKRKNRLNKLLSLQFLLIKVLSSEMDPPEIRLIRKVFVEERGVEVLEKSTHPPSCESS